MFEDLCEKHGFRVDRTNIFEEKASFHLALFLKALPNINTRRLPLPCAFHECSLKTAQIVLLSARLFVQRHRHSFIHPFDIHTVWQCPSREMRRLASWSTPAFASTSKQAVDSRNAFCLTPELSPETHFFLLHKNNATTLCMSLIVAANLYFKALDRVNLFGKHNNVISIHELPCSFVATTFAFLAVVVVFLLSSFQLEAFCPAGVMCLFGLRHMSVFAVWVYVVRFQKDVCFSVVSVESRRRLPCVFVHQRGFRSYNRARRNLVVPNHHRFHR